jgi:dTDP-glucose pyrophosphorylase
MLNILVPLAGRSVDENGQQFPLPLTELSGKPIIQLVVENLSAINVDKKFIFVVNQDDCAKFHLDDTIRLLTGNNSTIIRVQNKTKGAACTSLLAAPYIMSADPLIISNSDQIIHQSLMNVHSLFDKKSYDAGVICFDSVHPRFSYIRVDNNGLIVEVAEKKPISRNAIAGFYWFRRGEDFVRAAMKTIDKDASVDGAYFIAPTLNELILEGMTIGFHKIPNEDYASFYSVERRSEYQVSGPKAV